MLKTTEKLGVVLFLLGWFLSYSLFAALNTPTFHLDGAFQTASGLFRLDAGQFPGRDFYPYLGIGPLLTIYPLFKVLGSDLAASVFSAQFMTLLFSWMASATLWQFIFRPKSFFTAVIAGGICFITPIVATFGIRFALPQPFFFAVDPGNSLRPIRSIAPYLLAISYYFFVLDIKSARLKSAVSGCLTGIILLWSNDFAIPSAGLFGLFIAASFYVNRQFTFKNALM